MLGAFLSVEMVPWISLLFAVFDMLFIFCFLPETLPQEKRVGPGPGRGEGACGYAGVSFLICTTVRGDWPALKLLASQHHLAFLDLGPYCLTGPGPSAARLCAPSLLTSLHFFPQASSVTLGFHTAANLLSPLALLRFAAVAHSQDPPAEDSKEPYPLLNSQVLTTQHEQGSTCGLC